MTEIGDRARKLYDETREELGRVDEKASVLLAVNGILLAALLAALLAGNFKPKIIDNTYEWVFWTGAVALLVSEVLLCAAVFPRVRGKKRRSPPRFFGDVVGLERDELVAALDSVEDPDDRLIDQLAELAPVARYKYWLIAAGQVSLAGGVSLCALSALLQAA